MNFLVSNYSCLQNLSLGGVPPPDPRSLCPLSSTEFVEPPPLKKSWVRHWYSDDGGLIRLLRGMYRVLERLTAHFIPIQYPCQKVVVTVDRRGGRGSEICAGVSLVEMP